MKNEQRKKPQLLYSDALRVNISDQKNESCPGCGGRKYKNHEHDIRVIICEFCGNEFVDFDLIEISASIESRDMVTESGRIFSSHRDGTYIEKRIKHF